MLMKADFFCRTNNEIARSADKLGILAVGLAAFAIGIEARINNNQARILEHADQH